jgi:hypothetical protein
MSNTLRFTIWTVDDETTNGVLSSEIQLIDGTHHFITGDPYVFDALQGGVTDYVTTLAKAGIKLVSEDEAKAIKTSKYEAKAAKRKADDAERAAVAAETKATEDAEDAEFGAFLAKATGVTLPDAVAKRLGVKIVKEESEAKGKKKN